MTDGAVPPAGSWEDIFSRLVRSSARASTRVWRNALDLWKIPLELGAAEDQSLGVWHTTVFFPPGAGDARLRCVSITKHPSATLLDLRIRLDPTDFPRTGEPHEIAVRVPGRFGPGFYRFTLEDEGSGETKMYRLPFGIPGS